MAAETELTELVREVEGRRRTLTVFNPTGSTEAIERVERFLEPQRVSLRLRTTPIGEPRDAAVLHDDGRFVAASDFERVIEAVSLNEDVVRPDGRSGYPDVLEHVDDATFVGYGRRRMVVASREIEGRAGHAGAGELHAGFQRLSRIDEQRSLYRRLADAGVDVHAYGRPDGSVPDGVTPHGAETGELADTWFVLLDAPGERRGLVAREVEPGRFEGFWTCEDALVGRAITRLRSRYVGELRA